MGRILPDREIRPLLRNVIVGGADECVRSNSYELRLGAKVRFDSTGEEMELISGYFLEIQPGDFVTVSSSETLDFRREAISQVGKKINLMGLITPTTTNDAGGVLVHHNQGRPRLSGYSKLGNQEQLKEDREAQARRKAFQAHIVRTRRR